MEAAIAWVLAHQGILGALVVGLLDLIFAVIPSWQSNGILHWVLVMAKKIAGKNPPAA